jgi:hypothetical protein
LQVNAQTLFYSQLLMLVVVAILTNDFNILLQHMSKQFPWFNVHNAKIWAGDSTKKSSARGCVNLVFIEHAFAIPSAVFFFFFFFFFFFEVVQ